jgi:hypothetical protein
VTRAAADDAVAVTRRDARYESATLVPLLQQAGVTLVAGTDAGFLNSLNGPTFLQAADGYGAVAPGKIADPTRAIRAAVAKGPVLDRAALDAIVRESEAQAAGRPPAARGPVSRRRKKRGTPWLRPSKGSEMVLLVKAPPARRLPQGWGTAERLVARRLEEDQRVLAAGRRRFGRGRAVGAS